MLLPAFRAFSLDDEGDRVGIETFGEFKTRDMDVFHTEGTLARLAIEMDMPVVVVALTVFLAKFVVENTSTILEGMYHVVFQK